MIFTRLVLYNIEDIITVDQKNIFLVDGIYWEVIIMLSFEKSLIIISFDNYIPTIFPNSSNVVGECAVKLSKFVILFF